MNDATTPTPELDGDEYIEIPDDTETDIDGEHPEGDYDQSIYNDDEFDDIDVVDAAVPEYEDEEV